MKSKSTPATPDIPKGPYETLVDAARMLTDTGFVEAFSSPGRPRPWVHRRALDRRYAIGQSDHDALWYIVDYPGRAVVPLAEIARLAEERLLREAEILV